MFNVISELHQKAVNHAKEIYLILKTDPIYGGIFLRKTAVLKLHKGAFGRLLLCMEVLT